ncbi:transcriptional regulator [Rhodococcus sp. BE178]|uniref:transcriptional regulator n=1 Tax=Rhodococcus sp. BE178 TaxID=2817737 RepID=UPI003D2074F4
MDHKQWLAELTTDTTNGAAEKAGITPATLFRQLSRGRISAENVIALSRAYGKKAGDELVHTGFLERSDIEGVGIESALRLASSRQMLDEIDRRMGDGHGDDLNTKPSERN